jgi:hypothetical protein
LSGAPSATAASTASHPDPAAASSPWTPPRPSPPRRSAPPPATASAPSPIKKSPPWPRSAPPSGALDPDDQGRLPVSFERYDHSYSVRLHFHRFQEEGFPPEVKDGDRLVRYGDQDVPADEVMDQDSVLAVLARYAGESVDFVFVRPSYRFTTRLPVGSAPLPMLQLLLFLLGVGVAGAVAWWRRRAEGEEAPWWLLSAVSVAAPWGMSLLLAPDVALWDPPRLAAGLVALALWRPLSLLLHRALRGPLWRGLWIGALAPGALLGAAGLLALLGALAGIGADGGAPEEAVVNVIRAAAAFVALCQVVDLGWWLWERRARPAPTPWPLWGVAASSLALLPAAASLISDPERFSQGGFLLPTAAMLLILWVGDMTLFVSAAPSSPPRARERAATGLGALSQTAAADFFAYLRDRLAPDAPVLVVVQGRQARCLQPVWGDDEDMPELSFFDAGEIWRAAVGLLRDERMSLPISLQEEEASPSSAEAVRGLSDKLGWTVAFCLLDEALQMDSPSHELRERALYAFLVVERGLCEISPSERDALRDGFRPAWAHLRARFLAHEAPSPLRAPEPEPAPGATLEPAPSLIAAVPAPSPAPAPESTPAPEVVATPEPAPEVAVLARPRAGALKLVVLPAAARAAAREPRRARRARLARWRRRCRRWTRRWRRGSRGSPISRGRWARCRRRSIWRRCAGRRATRAPPRGCWGSSARRWRGASRSAAAQGRGRIVSR